MGLTTKDLSQIKDIIVEQSKNIFNKEYLQQIADKVVETIGATYEKRLQEHQEEISALNMQVDNLKKDVKKLELQIDNQEQVSRNLNIRIFGVPQKENEDIMKITSDILTKNMKLSIVDTDIKKCHRVYTKTVNTANLRPPAILVRFCDNNTRSQVLKNRKCLKSSGIHIQEDLTKYRLYLLDKAVKKFTNKNVWCLNGNVYVRCNNTVHRLEDEKHLETLNG